MRRYRRDYSYRRHYSWLIYIAIALMMAGCTDSPNDKQKQYNVLFIAVDDLRPELGCYDHDWILSPNIDKLAESGMVFNRAYCQVPVCGASRASLMTGLRPTPTRFLNFKTYVDQDAQGARTLPQEFKDNGYYCISNGKIFHHKEDAAERSWSEPPWRPYLDHLIFLNPESITMVGGKGIRGPVFESADVPDNAYGDGMVADKTIKDLRKLEKEGKPFFLACGFSKPHLPFYAPKKYWDLYDPAEIIVADNQYKPINAPVALRGSGEINMYHNRNIEYNSDEWHRKLRHGYYACVSYVDAQIGRVIETLDELGLSENTIVILWGDHGWHLGEHNFWGKHNLMSLATNSPMIVTGPGIEAGQKCNRLVEFVDIYSSLCDLVGINYQNKELQGTSFKPLLSDPHLQWKEAVFFRFGPGDGVITDRYNYAEFNNGENMLYDLQNDLAENINISGSAEHREIVEQLSQMLTDGWQGVLPKDSK
jgi:iduronate 2-sulfatase